MTSASASTTTSTSAVAEPHYRVLPRTPIGVGIGLAGATLGGWTFTRSWFDSARRAKMWNMSSVQAKSVYLVTASAALTCYGAELVFEDQRAKAAARKQQGEMAAGRAIEPSASPQSVKWTSEPWYSQLYGQTLSAAVPGVCLFRAAQMGAFHRSSWAKTPFMTGWMMFPAFLAFCYVAAKQEILHESYSQPSAKPDQVQGRALGAYAQLSDTAGAAQ